MTEKSEVNCPWRATELKCMVLCLLHKTKEFVLLPCGHSGNGGNSEGGNSEKVLHEGSARRARPRRRRADGSRSGAGVWGAGLGHATEFWVPLRISPPPHQASGGNEGIIT